MLLVVLVYLLEEGVQIVNVTPARFVPLRHFMDDDVSRSVVAISMATEIYVL